MCLKLKGTLSDIVLEGGQASRLSEAFSRIRVKRARSVRSGAGFVYMSPARDHNVTSLHIKF